MADTPAMDLFDLVQYPGSGKPRKTPSEDAASAMALALLPMAQVCLFVYIGEKGVNPFVLLLALPLLAAVLAHVTCQALKVDAGQSSRWTLGCVGICLLWDFPALFLVAVSSTF